MLHGDTRHLRRYGELDAKTFLVCVGAAKCGTSWLWQYLGGLPGVAVSPLKELHFFDTKFSALALGDMDRFAAGRVAIHLDRAGDVTENLLTDADFQASVDRLQMIYDDNAYFSHFARLATPETRVLCDITPGYSVLGSAGFDYLKGFFASQDVTLKLLFLMRDPVDRLWSQLRHMQATAPETRAVERWADALTSPPIMGRCDYRGTVADLGMTFAPDQVHYAFYEDLFSERSLRRLCDFIGVSYRPGDTGTRQNQTRLTADMPVEAKAAFLDALAPQYGFCRDRFGPRVPSSWAG